MITFVASIPLYHRIKWKNLSLFNRIEKIEKILKYIFGSAGLPQARPKAFEENT